MEIISGNTFGARLWSDGKSLAIMHPSIPRIALCKHCLQYFWLEKAQELGEWLGGCPKEWNQAPYLIHHLFFEDCQKCLEEKLYRNREEEFYLRMSFWYAFNDFYRDKKERKISPTMREINQKNMLCLQTMLDTTKIDELIIQAELYRQLRKFKACIQLLDKSDIPQEYLSICQQIKEKAIQKSTKLFRIIFPEVEDE